MFFAKIVPWVNMLKYVTRKCHGVAQIEKTVSGTQKMLHVTLNDILVP